MYIILRTPCIKCSFYWVVDKLKKYLKLYYNIDALVSTFGLGQVNIDDTVNILQKYSSQPLKIFAWVDTTLHLQNFVKTWGKIKANFTFVTTSKWNYNMMRDVDLNVVDIIPRAIDDEMSIKFVKIDSREKTGFVTLGVTNDIDRKQTKFMDAYFRFLNMRSQITIISNFPTADIQTWSLSDEVKYLLFAKSRWYIAMSLSEGFGIPPVEAMSVGTPAIYLNAHAFRETLVGIPVDPVDETVLQHHHVWLYKQQDLKRAIDYALTMSRDEYEDLAHKAYEKSKMYTHKVVLQQLEKYVSFH